MPKSTERAETWQTRSANFSTHGSRKGLNLLGWDIGTIEHMTPTQERDAIKARVQQLRALFEKGGLPSADHKRLALEFNELNQRMHLLRPKLKGPSGIQEFLIEVVREKLTNREWGEIMKEAIRRQVSSEKDGE